MGMCGGGGGDTVYVEKESQQKLDLMAAQKRQLDAQQVQLEQDKADRLLLEPYILKNMKLKKTIGAGGQVSYTDIPALLDPNGPASRENLNPEYFNTEDEKDAFILSALSLAREKKAAAGELDIPMSVEQDITEQRQNLLQNLEERYGKRYMESTGGSKGLLDFESNAAGLREKIRTGKATESADISSKMMSNYIRPQGYGYDVYSPTAGLVGSMSNAMKPYYNNARSQYEDSYMGGYINASDRADKYDLLGYGMGTAAGWAKDYSKKKKTTYSSGRAGSSSRADQNYND